MNIEKVYLAVGHGITAKGTHDPGATGGGWDEQTAGDIVVQSAAYKLRSWGVQVKDESYSNDPNFSGTDDLVRAWGADLLVSVHHDWIKASTGFFSLWYRENGRVLGKVIESHVARAGFPLRSYPNAGYRDDLSILKTVGSIPNTLIECGRIGQYTAQQLEKLGEAVAYGIAEYAGIDTQEAPDMTDEQAKALAQLAIDVVKLRESAAASSGRETQIITLLQNISDKLDALPGVDLSGYQVLLVKKG